MTEQELWQRIEAQAHKVPDLQIVLDEGELSLTT